MSTRHSPDGCLSGVSLDYLPLCCDVCDVRRSVSRSVAYLPVGRSGVYHPCPQLLANRPGLAKATAMVGRDGSHRTSAARLHKLVLDFCDPRFHGCDFLAQRLWVGGIAQRIKEGAFDKQLVRELLNERRIVRMLAGRGCRIASTGGHGPRSVA